MNEQVTTPTETTTPTPGVNEPAARTPDGQLKDQATAKPETTTLTTQELSPEEKAAAEAKAKAKAEGEKPGEKKEAPTGAPEKYEAFTLPEGLELSEAVLSSASELFKTSNLDQATAQKFVDFHAQQVQALAKNALDTYNTLRDGWRKEVLADATLGANGDLKPEVKAKLSKAIDTLGPDLAPKFREALSLTGAGDHPAVLRSVLAFAEKLGEGKPVSGTGPSAFGQNRSGQGKPTAAQSIYPNHPSSAG